MPGSLGRGAIFSLAVLAVGFAGQAWAGDVECYASVVDEYVGEAMVSVMLEPRTGKVTSSTLSWTPQREDGAESTYFAMPAMLLDYTLGADGKLAGPQKVELLFSRATRGQVAVPSMQGMRVRVKGAQAETLDWDFDSLVKGEAVLAKLLRENAPAKVSVELMKSSGETEVTAVFDLSKTDKVAKMLGEARAEAERRAAAYRELAAKGTAGKSCPR